MSPLLSTLTTSICEDSIVTSVAILKLLHLLLHDYNFVNSITDGLSGSISLAAGVAGTLLLASHLKQHYKVFGYVLLSLEVYLLLPYVRRYLRSFSMVAYLWFTAGLALTTILLVGTLSVALGISCLIVIAWVCIFAPLVLLKIQKFKAKINGPWDEAVPRIPKEVLVSFEKKKKKKS